MKLPAAMCQDVILDERDLTPEQYIAVVLGGARLGFGEQFVSRIQASRDIVERFLREERPVYGVTTGVGANVRYSVPEEEAAKLQENIIRTHAVSVGSPMSEEETRGMILSIICNLGHGCSGVRPVLIERLRDYLNLRLVPYVPRDGSVGYLAPEAHMALTLVGEGSFLRDGKRTPAREVLRERHLPPLTLGCKEGLALITGTTSADAYGLTAVYRAQLALGNAVIAGCMTFEALHATVNALDAEAQSRKRYPEQQHAAALMRSILSGSGICGKYRDSHVQDACAVRTMPQIFGAAERTFSDAEKTFVQEMQSCSDNPLILPTEDGSGRAAMNGNFDGSFIAMYADLLSIGIAKTAGLAERLTDRLMNFHLNEGLPAFLVPDPGVNNGFMIVQYTQAALVSELKLLAVPASVDSVSTCAGQEDPVSMAYRACQKAYEASDKLLDIVAMWILCAAQAEDLRADEEKGSAVLEAVRKKIRECIPFVTEDVSLYPMIESAQRLVRSGALIEEVQKRIGPMTL
ncbi:HAL/PAL/TAL family ammonia-lyase [Chordicoccus furentiruminis]|uniref:HAL/PAL/TAL family ammonia-lyase n=1 Tax=Chordicoccus furentiruminis TaxID=2709410 RepID=UPI0023A881EF|nr:aromatic amino acid ammonia-lyase [Chordicoccus furentiruminis]